MLVYTRLSLTTLTNANIIDRWVTCEGTRVLDEGARELVKAAVDAFRILEPDGSHGRRRRYCRWR